MVKENDIVLFTPPSDTREWIGIVKKSWEKGRLVVCNLVDPDNVYELENVSNIRWVGDLFTLRYFLDFHFRALFWEKEGVMNKYLKTILDEMCKRVGADYGVVNSSDTWYWQFEWTPEQELDFRKWLVGYLMENKDARHYFGLHKNKKEIEEFAKVFVWNYGWKYND